MGGCMSTALFVCAIEPAKDPAGKHGAQEREARTQGELLCTFTNARRELGGVRVA